MYAGDINKNLEMLGTVVGVYDPHYGETIETEIYPLKLNGEIIDMVGTDKTGNIISIEIRDDKVVFDNTTTYGSLKENQVFGWCFDRENYVLGDFKSSEYYKER